MSARSIEANLRAFKLFGNSQCLFNLCSFRQFSASQYRYSLRSRTLVPSPPKDDHASRSKSGWQSRSAVKGALSAGRSGRTLPNVVDPDGEGRRVRQTDSGNDFARSSKKRSDQNGVTRLSRPYVRSYRESGASIATLKDPLKLAEKVRTLLRQDDNEAALELVRNASKDVACVVSWNHILDWLLAKGRANRAFTTFNEVTIHNSSHAVYTAEPCPLQMKKRRQPPNAHTYTILFRGLKNHVAEVPSLLHKALAIYRSMSSEKAVVPVNIFHTNAILQICSRANSLETFYELTAELPEKGPCAPDKETYTIIFNTLYATTIDAEGDDEQNHLKVVERARRIWADVLRHVREGRMAFDEVLVCSFGKILLLGSNHDVDDIFSLLQQTMNLPRQFPRLETKTSATMPSHQQETELTTRVLTAEDPLRGSTAHDGYVDLFAPRPAALPEKTSLLAKPGRITLSLLDRALSRAGHVRFMVKYWHLIIVDHGTFPDDRNYEAYLKTLNSLRASSQTVKLIEAMPEKLCTAANLCIAMDTCKRDRNNHNSLSNAQIIFNIAAKRQTVPDPRFLSIYLKTAIATSASSASSHSSLSKSEEGVDGKLCTIESALDQLYPELMKLCGSVVETPGSRSSLDNQSRIEDVADVVKISIGVYDRSLKYRGQSITRLDYKRLEQHRSSLAAMESRLSSLSRGVAS